MTEPDPLGEAIRQKHELEREVSRLQGALRRIAGWQPYDGKGNIRDDTWRDIAKEALK